MNKSHCQHDGCKERVHARNLCRLHYRIASGQRVRPRCSVAGCDKLARAEYAGMCANHYKASAPELELPELPAPKEARERMRTISEGGYVALLSPEVRARLDDRRKGNYA